MRVIAGTARSLPLKAPAGNNTRPTTDKIKETLFNMLQPDLPDGVFIDLFSGSGSIGIEALSRGASCCYFVENDLQAVNCIKENLTFTKLLERAVILKNDVSAALMQIKEKEADIIFMDPPYDQGYDKRILQILAKMSYVTENTTIIVEASLAADFSYAELTGFSILKQKIYKNNQHVFLRKTDQLS